MWKSKRSHFPHHDCIALDGRNPEPFGLLVSECNRDHSGTVTPDNREGFLSLKSKDTIWYLGFKWVASHNMMMKIQNECYKTPGEIGKCSMDSLPTQKSGVSTGPNMYPENNGVHKHTLTRMFLMSHLHTLSYLCSLIECNKSYMV